MKLRPHLWWFGVLVLPCAAWIGAESWERLHRARLSAQEYEPAPSGMVFVPSGEFLMGSNDPTADPDERPLRNVFVPAFYIDRFEVTNRRYKEFKKDHRYPTDEDDLPVTFVLKRDAEAFCRWAGKRLPTDAEWEKAARGTDGRMYPWGNRFDAEMANIKLRTARMGTNTLTCTLVLSEGASRGKRHVGSFPEGASPYGCEDMAGNVWEWVADAWVDNRGFLGNRRDEGRGILRGGAYNYSPLQARASHRGFESLNATCHDVGFRCAMDAVVRTK
jgi:formylglycine-generating enzyme required for sulfatase activity